MLKSIGVEAFKGCDFKEITIPEGVTVIGDEAFATCESLEYVSLPDSMETLHNGLFSGCQKCIYNHRTTKTNQKYPSVNL